MIKTPEPEKWQGEKKKKIFKKERKNKEIYKCYLGRRTNKDLATNYTA